MVLILLHNSNKKAADPTVFTENATELEAGACWLQLPEVRNPLKSNLL